LSRTKPTYVRGRLGRFRRTALSSTLVFSSLDGKTGIDRNGVDKESTPLRRLLIDGDLTKQADRRRLDSG